MCVVCVDPARVDKPLRETTCLGDFGAYGACLEPIGHQGLCRDAFGYTFTGRKRPEAQPVPVAEPVEVTREVEIEAGDLWEGDQLRLAPGLFTKITSVEHVNTYTSVHFVKIRTEDGDELILNPRGTRHVKITFLTTKP